MGRHRTSAWHRRAVVRREGGLEEDVRLPVGIELSACRRLWCVVFARFAAYRVARWCSRGFPREPARAAPRSFAKGAAPAWTPFQERRIGPPRPLCRAPRPAAVGWKEMTGSMRGSAPSGSTGPSSDHGCSAPVRGSAPVRDARVNLILLGPVTWPGRRPRPTSAGVGPKPLPITRLVAHRCGGRCASLDLGLKAIEAGYRVLFTTAANMIAVLTKALNEGKLKVFTVPRLLIIDEIGYLPIERQGANLFFQLISRRYERGPMTRALHPLALPARLSDPGDAELRRGLYVDCETTGFSPEHDSVIELAMLPFTYTLGGSVVEVLPRRGASPPQGPGAPAPGRDHAPDGFDRRRRRGGAD